MSSQIVATKRLRIFWVVRFQRHLERSYTAPSYSTPAPSGISEAEVRSAKEYCSGLLQ